MFTVYDCLGVATCGDVAWCCYATSCISTLILERSSCFRLVSMQWNTTSQSIWYGSHLYPHRNGNVCTKVVVETNGIVTTKTVIQEDPTCASGTTWDAKSGTCKYCESGYTYRCVRVRSEGVATACGLMCVLVFLCSWQGRLGSLQLSRCQLFAHHVISLFLFDLAFSEAAETIVAAPKKWWGLHVTTGTT